MLQHLGSEFLYAQKAGNYGRGSRYVTGKIVQLNPPSGHMYSRFRASQELVSRKFRHNLILFDPDNYAVFYGCDSYWFGSEYMWAYSRSPLIPTNTLAYIHEQMRRQGVDLKDLVYTDQAQCLLRENNNI